MKFTAFHFVGVDEVKDVIFTDDYDEKEIALGKHILDLKRDIIKLSLTGVLVVFDENNKYVATI